MALPPKPPVCPGTPWFTIYSTPPNACFEVMDLDERWNLGNAEPWDLIYARFLAGSIKNWDDFFRQSYR